MILEGLCTYYIKSLFRQNECEVKTKKKHNKNPDSVYPLVFAAIINKMLDDNFKTQSAKPADVLCARSVVRFYYKFVVLLLFDIKFILRSFTE